MRYRIFKNCVALNLEREGLFIVDESGERDGDWIKIQRNDGKTWIIFINEHGAQVQCLLPKRVYEIGLMPPELTAVRIESVTRPHRSKPKMAGNEY